MEDDDLRRLIATDLSRDIPSERVMLSLPDETRKRGWRIIGVATAVVFVTIALLSAGYGLVSSILPPIDDLSLTSLLWAPVAMMGIVVVVGASLILSALTER